MVVEHFPAKKIPLAVAKCDKAKHQGFSNGVEKPWCWENVGPWRQFPD
jgi:hypothetical protein